MKVMLLNGSPKKKLSTSRYVQKTLKVMLGCKDIIECKMHTKQDIPGVIERLEEIDALVIAAPLYIDGIPSQVMQFMLKAEEVCHEKDYHFKVYCVTNSGFIEGHQNDINLAQYECWSERSGLSWGGGIGIGGGVILGVYTITIPIALLVFMLNLVTNGMSHMPLINEEMVSSLASDLGWFLFFSCGMFFCEAKLVYRIRKQREGKNMYTRFICPSFLFLLVADLFMLIMSVVKGGFFRNLFHREKLQADRWNNSRKRMSL